MKENVGTADQAVRALTGPALMAIGHMRFGGHGVLLAPKQLGRYTDLS